jgi:hypothetical protein
VYDSEVAYERYVPAATAKALRKLKREVQCYLETVSTNDRYLLSAILQVVVYAAT